MSKTSKLTPKEFDVYKDILCNIILKHVPTCKIYLYGSRARNQARSGSDIDIALDNNNKIVVQTITLLKSDIEDSTIPFFVDVVDLHNVSEQFKTAIQRDMILWKT